MNFGGMKRVRLLLIVALLLLIPPCGNADKDSGDATGESLDVDSPPVRSSSASLGGGSGGVTETGANLTDIRYSSASLGDLNGYVILDLVVSAQNAAEIETTKVYLEDGCGDRLMSEETVCDPTKSSRALWNVRNLLAETRLSDWIFSPDNCCSVIGCGLIE